ncbi:200 kDa antigen p200, putative [Burkholderia pseudomallei 1710b]|uniref:200 kDa antigen p200, putative n=1 Tax=Burkholderia pseudomallei (strain 1710b) TaxID=320372 RepID=Q3JVW2_BURP1|nr:200 kDa antigen p200, putative [Burkholderia pseudomallei 1710b]
MGETRLTSGMRGVGRAGGAACAVALVPVRVRIDAAHFRFDPVFDAFVQLVGGEALRVDRLADRHRDGAGVLRERVARPHAPGVVRDRHDGRAGADREARAARLVLALAADRRARPLGEHDDPRAFRHPLAALADHRIECVLAVLAVDVDHVQHPERPAEERHVQQLALEHVAERLGHQRGQRDRLPCGLMLRQQHGRAVGQVLVAFDAVPDAREPARDEQRRFAPADRHPVARVRPHERERDEARGGVRHRIDDEIDEQQQGADEAHRRDVTVREDARGSASLVFFGKEIERERAQIVVHARAFRQPARGERLLALARQHEMRPKAERLARLQVAQRIADHRRIRRIDLEALRDQLHHPGLRLAAVAMVVGRVRAEEHRVDPPADGGRRAMHLQVHRVQRRHVEQAPADARLVRRDDDAVARVIEPRDRLEAAGQRDPFVGRLDERVRIDVDDAVPIEDDEFLAETGRHRVAPGLQAASFEMSATQFICWCSADRSASRFARSAGSSALTITPSKNASTGARSAASAVSAPVYARASSCDCTRGVTSASCSASAFSAASTKSAGCTAPFAPLSDFFRMFEIRLFAAASASASARRVNSRTALRRATMSSRRVGFRLSTASISPAV